MQIYPLRIDIDLEICSRVPIIFVIGREYIYWSRIFWLVEIFFFQAEDGIRDVERSRGLGDVYKRQRQAFKLVQFLTVRVICFKDEAPTLTVSPLPSQNLSLIHI